MIRPLIQHCARWLAALAFLSLLAPALPAAQEAGPEALVKSTTEEVLTVINQTHDSRKLVQVAEAKVLPHFDFAHMTRLAVGRNWPRATPEQQKALEKAFQTLLVRTYTNSMAASKARNATVQVSPSRAEANATGATVRTKVTIPGNRPIAIDYDMDRQAAGWKVYDVTVDGVSLVTSYRHTFAERVTQSGMDGLVKFLEEKNRAAAAATPASG